MLYCSHSGGRYIHDFVRHGSSIEAHAKEQYQQTNGRPCFMDPPESFVRELDGSTCLAQLIGPTGILQLGLEADAAGQTC